ncbi:beta-L-arabinofuranosidase domain-containing protein [bacterium]
MRCSRDAGNRHYPVNINPLMQNRYVKLPLGNVKPMGWLKDQLQAQAEGLTGHLDVFWPDLINSAWRGGDGEAWERGPYYLDGLVPLAYLLEDKKLIRKVKAWTDAIINSSRPDGWYGPEKNEDRWPLAVASKLLYQYYEITRDERALEILKGYFRYLHDNPPDWPDDTWRGVRAMEHAVTGFSLFRLTQNPDILETIESIFTNSFDWTSYYETFPWDSQAVADGKLPLNWKADGLTAHVVNNGMAVKYPGLWYQQAGDKRFRDAVYAALEKYDRHHGQIGGRFSGDEHLAGRRPTQGTELCTVVEFMFSLENLLEILGDPAFADRLESLAYNALPGTMTPDCWAHQYDQQSNQVLVTRAKRDWTTNGDASNIYGLMPNYPCCLANMHQGWPKLVQHMWMATHDNGLAAIVYGPNHVTAKVGQGTEVTIIQETLYPFDGTVRLKMELQEKGRFPLHLRIPDWADGTTIRYGSKTDHPKAGTIIRINREWHDGDEVLLTMPMEIQTERRYRNSAAVRRGPLYFGLRIGKDYRRFVLKERNFGSIKYKGSVDWEIRPTTPWNYGLILDKENGDNFTIQTHPITRYPFSDRDEMIFDAKQSGYKKWKQDAPVVLTVKARRIPDWKLKNNSADDPPLSPVHSDESLEEIQLVPYGCARLRISEFPVLQ